MLCKKNIKNNVICATIAVVVIIVVVVVNNCQSKLKHIKKLHLNHKKKYK